MRRLNSTGTSDQAGFALIEVLISAAILLTVAAGVFTAFGATTRASSFERARARADALAEQDLERVRSLRIADLSTLNQTRTVTVDGTTYTIVSTSQFLQETASTSTCASGTGSRDFLQLRSTVTWQGMGVHSPVTAATLVSPPSGSLVPNSGSLLVAITDSKGSPIPGVTLTGSGSAGSFSGSTGTTGCVLWHNLPAGTYTMSLSGAASGMVDQDGDPAPAETVSIVDQATNTIERTYDRPGSIQGITFRTRTYSGSLVASTVDTATVSAADMDQVKTYGTPGGTRQTTFNAGPPATLFPFTYPYTVYGGSCTANDPTSDSSAAGAFGSATVPPGGTATLASPGYVVLPSLLVTLWSGTSSFSPGSRVSGGDVTVQDASGGCGVTRTLTLNTNSSGQIPVAGDVGLPYGTYIVCANNSARTDRRVVTAAVHDTNGTSLNVYLGNTTGGACP